jgi:adenylate kinase family enzyme
VIGRRIVVYGATGSGKSTLTRRLGEALGVGVVELDGLMHQPDWVPTPDDEFRAKILDAIAQYPGGWVCDGNYGQARALLLSRADTVVWLDLPWRVSFRRLLRRTLRRAWTKEPLWNTNTESWRQSFLSKESILWWSITQRKASPERVRRALAESEHAARVVRLCSPAEVADFVRALERALVDAALFEDGRVRRAGARAVG